MGALPASPCLRAAKVAAVGPGSSSGTVLSFGQHLGVYMAWSLFRGNSSALRINAVSAGI